jgi:hypothetical protein
MNKWVDPALAALACVLVWSLTWDAGYRVISLETFLVTGAALAVAMLLSLAGRLSPAWRMGGVGLLFLLLVAAFFVPHPVIALGIVAAGSLVIGALHRWLQAPFFVVFALVFLGAKSARDVAQAHTEPPSFQVSATDETRIIVHWVMDEMGSFESVPAPYRVQAEIDEIHRNYMTRGFRIHPNLPSVSPDTYISLSEMLNVSVVKPGARNVVKLPDQNAYRIIDNSLHRAVADAGWSVHITQSSFVDFCSNQHFSCNTYQIGKRADVFERATLPFLQRLTILWRELTARVSGRSEQSWKRATPTLPLVALEQIDLAQAGMLKVSGKHYVFAHFLLPHFPWTLDKQCALKPLDAWVLPYAARKNSRPGKRDAALAAYWDQAYCTHKRILQTVDALDAAFPGQVSFLIHGDHGPRILGREIPSEPAAVVDDDMRRNVLEPFVATRVAVESQPDENESLTMQAAITHMLVREAGVELGSLAKSGASQVLSDQ